MLWDELHPDDFRVITIDCLQPRDHGIAVGNTKYVFAKTMKSFTSYRLVNRPYEGRETQSFICPDCRQTVEINVNSAKADKFDDILSVSLYIIMLGMIYYAYQISSWLIAIIAIIMGYWNASYNMENTVKVSDNSLHKVKKYGTKKKICDHYDCKRYGCNYVRVAVQQGLVLDTINTNSLIHNN